MSRFLTTGDISANILTKSKSSVSSFIFSPPHFTSINYHLPKPNRLIISIRAVISTPHAKSDDVSSEDKELDNNGGLRGDNDEYEYPSGEFEFKKPVELERNSFKAKLHNLIDWSRQRVRQGSVLNMELRGQISDQLKTPFSSVLSLPQICENLIKAAYDPRISGVYVEIETLNCGWGIIEEIRRHILDFRKSGKLIVGYASVWGEKEYYLGCACEELYSPPSAYFSLYGLTAQAQFYGGLLEKVGVEPLVQRIGKYKSAGDQLTRKNMSEENREALTRVLDNIYGNWVDKISGAKGKKKEEIERFINEGVYEIEKLKEGGWITDIKYYDEVTSMLKTKLGISLEKPLPFVGYKKYSRVTKQTLGLSGGSDEIAVIRASGSISRVREPFSSNSGIIAEQFIEKIRNARDSRYRAVIIRIDSPGGDALASDLMWREIRLLAKSKPVVASMVDVAASGGYYMAMAAGTIVSENLTLTGSIGVVTGKFNLGKLYERIGFNKEIISKGRFAELYAAEHRPFRPDEEELFAKSAQNVYKQFRNKAAYSRSMTVDEMEEVAQGRVWSGSDAASRGLVDAIGGFSRAVAIAKHKANIPQDKQVTLVELSQPSFTIPEILSSIIDTTLKELLVGIGLTSSGGAQARMDEIIVF